MDIDVRVVLHKITKVLKRESHVFHVSFDPVASRRTLG